jgi:hypothetical protein
MVFGFGEGKMEIRVSKTAFAPGETISGTVLLQLSKPKKARGVRVEFFGERTVGYGKNRRTERVYQFKLDLDGEKEFDGYKEYPFEIRIPSDIGTKVPNDTLGTVLNAAQFLGGVSPTRWFLSASLDVPMGMDISKRIQLNIG